MYNMQTINLHCILKLKYKLQYKIHIVCFDIHGMRRELHQRNKTTITGKNDIASATDQRKRIANTTSGAHTSHDVSRAKK